MVVRQCAFICPIASALFRFWRELSASCKPREFAAAERPCHHSAMTVPDAVNARGHPVANWPRGFAAG